MPRRKKPTPQEVQERTVRPVKDTADDAHVIVEPAERGTVAQCVPKPGRTDSITGIESGPNTNTESVSLRPEARSDADQVSMPITAKEYRDERTGIWFRIEIPPGVLKSGQLAEVLTRQEVNQTIRTVIEAMTKYDERLLKRHLDYVYICRSLNKSGETAGGQAHYDKDQYDPFRTFQGSKAGSSSIILATKGDSEATIRSTFHHELAHLLLSKLRNDQFTYNGKQYRYFLEDKWLAACPPGFQYDRASRSSHLKGEIKDRDFAPDLLEQGFLRSYAQVSLPEDFCTFAQSLKIGSLDEKLKEAQRQYPRIKRKLELTMWFYACIEGRSFIEPAYQRIHDSPP